MREPLKDKGRLQHMLEMANMLVQEKAKHNYDKIKEDKLVFFGLSKMLEIIGESAYKITNEYKAANSELPWRQIVGMRHIMVHGYYHISPEILWDVIENDIPPLIPKLESLLQKID